MKPEYLDFLKSKKQSPLAKAKPISAKPHPRAKPHQADCLDHLLKIGRGAAFLDTGLGKTFLQVDFARHMTGKVLIVAPLGVCHQTINEARVMLETKITYSNDGSADSRITITNYDRLHLFDPSVFECVILDESSILKGKNSKTKNKIIEMFSETPYRLACTATPAPNDYTEIGNHAEFLGIMNTMEMLTRWFVHDSMNTGDWRLKGHAENDFWEWVSSWACCVSKPSDLGHSDEGYDLPPLTIKTHTVEGPLEHGEEDMLFDIPTVSATDLHRVKRMTIEERCQMVADMVNNSKKPWIVWCESNDESAMLSKMIPDGVEVKGSDKPDQKEASAAFFAGYELSEKELHLIGKLPDYCRWKSLHINKNTTVQIGQSELRNLLSTKRKTVASGKNTLVNTTKKIGRNTKELQSNKRKSIDEEGKNTQLTKNTEKSKKENPNSTQRQTLGREKPNGSKSLESPLMSLSQCIGSAEASVKFADLLTMATQGFSLSSIIAIQPDESGACYVADVILGSGSFKTTLTELDLQSVIFGKRVLISKPSIFGYGLNFQHCRNMAFASISYSYEKFYQAVRRSWRFGQTKPVHIDVVLADCELPVWRAVESKATDHESMKAYMKKAVFKKRDSLEVKVDYNPTHKATLPSWL